MERILDLFNTLHNTPELSLCEKNTNAIIYDFLQKNTTLKVYNTGSFVYGVHFENENYENVAFRADTDAIKNEQGLAFHGCGHDGHSATLCSLALMLEGKQLGKNVYLLFQPAEEIGEGAKIVSEYLSKLNINRIYGFHNIPKYKEGSVILKSGTFACASKGITLNFTGKQSHAAYPENGINPAFAIAGIIGGFDRLLDKSLYKGLVLATIVNVTVGEKQAFGVNAGLGELSVTIRSEYTEDLVKLENTLLALAKDVCTQQKIGLDCKMFDQFPATYNSSSEYKRVRDIVIANGLEYIELNEPMRWSEDFGWYLEQIKGVFIGIGAGMDHPDLHTKDYCYNTSIIEHTAKLLIKLI